MGIITDGRGRRCARLLVVSTVAGRLMASLAATSILTSAVGGCYSYVPADTRIPAQGSSVAIDVTDQGRLSLAGKLGPEVYRLEGTLVRSDAASVGITLSNLQYIHGQRTTWSGESVSLDRADIKSVYERRLNRTKTALVAGVLAGASLFIALSQDLFGQGSESDTRLPRPPDEV